MPHALLSAGGRGIMHVAVSSIPIIGIAISVITIPIGRVCVSLVFMSAAVSLARAPSGVPTAALLSALTAAGEEDDYHANEEQDHCSKCCPHANGIVGVRPTAVGIDVVLDYLHKDQYLASPTLTLYLRVITYSERCEIDRHHD